MSNPRADRGEKLRQGGRFSNIVVSAKLERQSPIGFRLRRGENQHRNGVQLRKGAHVFQDIEARYSGQVQIDDDDVGQAQFADPGEDADRFLAVVAALEFW